MFLSPQYALNLPMCTTIGFSMYLKSYPKIPLHSINYEVEIQQLSSKRSHIECIQLVLYVLTRGRGLKTLLELIMGWMIPPLPPLIKLHIIFHGSSRCHCCVILVKLINNPLFLTNMIISWY